MKLRAAVILLLGVLLVTACSDDNDNNRSTQELTILVTNDDGIEAPGIDTMVSALVGLKNVEVRVVAPAENQSGSSDTTTEGELAWNDSATATGYMAVAVFGYPADAVRVALEELAITPDLVVSGINQGQNVGPFAALSGTVGAARYAARAGYPAVAASAGLGGNADYDAAAALVVAWIEEHRDALAGGTASTEFVTSFNVPGCTAGEIRELVEVPLADAVPPGVIPFVTDCSIEPDAPPIDDIDAMVKGFAAETEVPLEL